jgi:hypothetical protein
MISSPLQSITTATLEGDATIGSVLGLFGLALLIGLLIDGVQFISLTFLTNYLAARAFGQKPSARRPSNVEDFDFIDRVHGRYLAWQQFYNGSAIVALFAGLFEIFGVGFVPVSGWFFLLISAALVFAASRSTARMEYMLAERFGNDSLLP